MQIINLSQQQDREAWLDMRREKVTGTKKVAPTRSGESADFWQLVADRIAVAADGEPDNDRGQRLENTAIDNASKILGLEFDKDPGFWVSDDNPNIALSPDGAEPGKKPTYAVECKSLASKNHIQFVLQDLEKKQEADYNPIESLTIGYRNDYRWQAKQYFIVNEHLKDLYFVLEDDRIVLPKIATYIIHIERSEVEDQLKEQIEIEHSVLERVDNIVKRLVEANDE